MKKIYLCFVILFCFQFTNAQVTFTNVAESLGIDHTYFWPFFNAGLSFCDFDKDGYEDITLPTVSGQKIHLYKFDGTSFTNIVDQTNLDDTMRVDCVLWADYDNDGDRDFFLTNRNSSDHLYRNDNGQFTDATAAAGLPVITEFTTAACWADYDRDGFIDLYVGTRDWNLGSYLYHNNGDGTFTDVTDVAGVSNFAKLPLAISFLDYNNDGWQDIYTANDLHQGNTLFKNNGDGTFTDVSVQSGADVYVSGMGIAIGDYDDNGYLDMYITNIDEGNAFLHNNGDGTFTEMASYLHIDVGKFGWGTSFFDYDNDGDLDLLVNNSGGLQGRDDPNRNNAFFRNNGDGQFTELFDTGLEADTFYSYGSAIADYNSDGYLDVAIINAYGHKSQLFKSSGGTNNWIKLTLDGTISNKDAIGSRIELWRNGYKIIRTTHCGVSYESQDSFILTIGVGSSTVIDSIRVIWPSGLTDSYQDIAVNQNLFLTEGETLQLPNPVTFSDATSLYRINHTYNSLDIAGGVSFVDANNDGKDDVTFTTAAGENIQHLRNKNSSLKNIINRMNISELGTSKAVIWADYDNDRDEDLFVVNFGSPNRLYRNDRGIFSDVTDTAGLSLNNDFSTSAVFFDYNNDGFLDLYISNSDDLQGNVFYKNNSDGTFTDLTDIINIQNLGKHTISMVSFDFNNDGYNDIYCTNDLLQGNTLFKNTGFGTLIDVSSSAGVDLQLSGAGLAVGDYNNDGFQDIYLTNGPDGNILLQNNGDETFSIDANSTELAVNKFCSGANFLDYDNDGDLDLYVSVYDDPTPDSSRNNILFWNKGFGIFGKTLASGIDIDNSPSFGNAVGDLDNNGYSDIIVLNSMGFPSKLYKNDGWTNNWIKLKLRGSLSNSDGIGSIVKIFLPDRIISRQILNQVSFASQNSLSLIAGLGNFTSVDSIQIFWTSGVVDVFQNIAVNQTTTINEGTGNFSSKILSKDISAPQDFSLSQNYPNPFNPSTVINYNLDKEGEVKLEVFDILGRKVRTLVDEVKQAGSYQINFEAGDFPSGVYVYQLKQADQIESKKMLILK